jgi:hypothetical protein
MPNVINQDTMLLGYLEYLFEEVKDTEQAMAGSSGKTGRQVSHDTQGSLAVGKGRRRQVD